MSEYNPPDPLPPPLPVFNVQNWITSNQVSTSTSGGGGLQQLPTQSYIGSPITLVPISLPVVPYKFLAISIYDAQGSSPINVELTNQPVGGSILRLNNVDVSNAGNFFGFAADNTNLVMSSISNFTLSGFGSNLKFSTSDSLYIRCFAGNLTQYKITVFFM